MRLDFNVLWVDDQPNYVQNQIRPIARHMEEHGFEFRPVHCTTLDEVKRLLADSVFNDEVDLVLVDWDLGGGIVGQDAIVAIREVIPFKDVLFYSARTSPDELRTLAHDARVDGVFCADRDNLVLEIQDVFDSLVKKVLDLDHSRGIVVGAAADIDQMVNECLQHAHGKLDGSTKKALVKKVIEQIDDRLKTVATLLDELRAAKGLEAFFPEHGVFTANDRLRVLANVLKLDLFKDHQPARKAVTIYMNTVVPDRNILAHIMSITEGGEKKVVNNKGVAIGLDETRELRRNMLNLRGDFRALMAALKS